MRPSVTAIQPSSTQPVGSTSRAECNTLMLAPRRTRVAHESPGALNPCRYFRSTLVGRGGRSRLAPVAVTHQVPTHERGAERTRGVAELGADEARRLMECQPRRERRAQGAQQRLAGVPDAPSDD